MPRVRTMDSSQSRRMPSGATIAATTNSGTQSLPGVTILDLVPGSFQPIRCPVPGHSADGCEGGSDAVCRSRLDGGRSSLSHGAEDTMSFVETDSIWSGGSVNDAATLAIAGRHSLDGDSTIDVLTPANASASCAGFTTFVIASL